MFGIPNPVSWLRTAVIAALVAGAVGLIAYAKGHGDGREYEMAKQARQTIEDIERRSENNEAVRSLDDCSAITELSGLPLADCLAGRGGL